MRLLRTLRIVIAFPLMIACGNDDHSDLKSPPATPDASTGSCASDDDCSGSASVCDVLGGSCVQCLFDTQCDGDAVCEGRACVKRVSCSNSLDCVGTPPRTICDLASNLCVECVEPADCVGTADCKGNRCEPYVSCTTSLDCPSGLVCAKAEGRCVACEAKADCPEGQDCVGNECKTIIPCVSDNQCTPSGQLCDKGLGYCVDCLNDVQCPDAYHCALGSCELDECEAGATKCQGNALATCVAAGGAWGAPVPCPSRSTCKNAGASASCLPWACEPGLTACVGDVAQTCSADGLSVVASVNCAAQGLHCAGGVCSNMACTPGSSFCAGNEVRVCNAEGTGSSVATVCSSAQYCDPGTASCKALLCAPGAPVCQGSVATVCNATGTGYEPGGTDCSATGEVCKAGACEAGTVAKCGWSPSNAYYACGYQGADPTGTNPIACPPNLVEGSDCGTVTTVGCCDENGDNWYCQDAVFVKTLIKEECSEPPPPAPGVRCGSSTCSTSQFCCFQSSTAASCVASGGACSPGTPIRCDGPEDCAGQVCCGESVGGSTYNVVECRSSCTATDNLVVCSPGGTNVCPSGTACEASAVLTGYYVCK